MSALEVAEVVVEIEVEDRDLLDLLGRKGEVEPRIVARS